MAGFSGPFKKPLVGNQHKLPENVKQGILDAPMKQQVFGGKKSVKLSENPPMAPPPRPPIKTREEIKPIIRLRNRVVEKTHEFPPKQKTPKLSPPSHELLHSAFPQVNEAGTEDASPGGGTPPKLKKKSKTIAQRIKDLELHKQTNTKEYKDLIAQVNKGYSEQGNYDEVD